MQLDLDNLTEGLHFPADPAFGTPAGTITAVEYRQCEDHDTWQRLCHRCEVRWFTEYAGPESGWTALDNKHLWTAADRAEVESNRPEIADEPQDGTAFDPWNAG